MCTNFLQVKGRPLKRLVLLSVLGINVIMAGKLYDTDYFMNMYSKYYRRLEQLGLQTTAKELRRLTPEQCNTLLGTVDALKKEVIKIVRDCEDLSESTRLITIINNCDHFTTRIDDHRNKSSNFYILNSNASLEEQAESSSDDEDKINEAEERMFGTVLPLQ
jgi:hypothetical protein